VSCVVARCNWLSAARVMVTGWLGCEVSTTCYAPLGPPSATAVAPRRSSTSTPGCAAAN